MPHMRADSPISPAGGFKDCLHTMTPRLHFPIGWVFDTIVPTILRLDGLRVVIYPNDHLPAHVHVIGPGMEAVFELNCPDGPVSLRQSYRFSPQQLRAILAGLTAALRKLCGEWRKIHEIDQR